MPTYIYVSGGASNSNSGAGSATIPIKAPCNGKLVVTSVDLYDSSDGPGDSWTIYIQNTTRGTSINQTINSGYWNNQSYDLTSQASSYTISFQKGDQLNISAYASFGSYSGNCKYYLKWST